MSDIKIASFKNSVWDIKTIGHKECTGHSECVKHVRCVLHTLFGIFSSLEFVFSVTSWVQTFFTDVSNSIV